MRDRLFTAVYPVFFLVFAAVSGLYALPRHQDIIEIENWVFLDSVGNPDISWPFPPFNPAPLSLEEAKRHLAGEAEWLVHGMVYGFRFHYQPEDRARGTGMEFVLEPCPGAVDSRHFDTPRFRGDNDRLRGWFVYHLPDFEERRYLSWYSNIVAESRGTGRVALEAGETGRIEAHKEAIRNAIHEYFRTVVANRPQRIEGDIAISSIPVSGIDGGFYVSTLRVRIRPRNVVPYERY